MPEFGGGGCVEDVAEHGEFAAAAKGVAGDGGQGGGGEGGQGCGPGAQVGGFEGAGEGEGGHFFDVGAGLRRRGWLVGRWREDEKRRGRGMEGNWVVVLKQGGC